MARRKAPVPSRVNVHQDDPRRFPFSRRPAYPQSRQHSLPSGLPPYMTRAWLHWFRELSDVDPSLLEILLEIYSMPQDMYEDRIKNLEASVFGLEALDILHRTAVERIPGAWILERLPSVTYTADVTLEDPDFGKYIKLNSASKITVTLQTASTANVDKWQVLVRLGAGEVWIDAAGADTIGPSSTLNQVRSVETRENPCLALYIPEATKWSFGHPGSYGIWKVY